jgi:hypothetical protein
MRAYLSSFVFRPSSFPPPQMRAAPALPSLSAFVPSCLCAYVPMCLPPSSFAFPAPLRKIPAKTTPRPAPLRQIPAYFNKFSFPSRRCTPSPCHAPIRVYPCDPWSKARPLRPRLCRALPSAVHSHHLFSVRPLCLFCDSVAVLVPLIRVHPRPSVVHSRRPSLRTPQPPRFNPLVRHSFSCHHCSKSGSTQNKTRSTPKSPNHGHLPEKSHFPMATFVDIFLATLDPIPGHLPPRRHPCNPMLFLFSAHPANHTTGKTWGTRIRTERNSALAGMKTQFEGEILPQTLEAMPPELREVISSWASMPETLRAAVLGIVRAARGA